MSPRSTAQNINPLTEQWKADDPLIRPAPEDEENRKEGSANKKYIRADVYLGKKIYEPRENK
jgi:hypothetical protein